jgi:hypothetical protein
MAKQNSTVVANNTQAMRIFGQANELSAKREIFETTTLARTNKELYGILSNVYRLFNDAVAEKCIKETLKLMKDVLAKRNVKVQSNSPALTVFVRYVFNSDRKRSYNYTRTLVAAAEAHIKPENLAEFIESKNGVEECKKIGGKKEETLQKEQKLKAATIEVEEQLAAMQPVACVHLPNTSVTLSDGAKYAFVVARVAANGDFELLRAVPTSTKGMHSTAVKELAKQLVDKKAEFEIKQKLLADKAATAKASKKLTVKAAANATVGELEAA